MGKRIKRNSGLCKTYFVFFMIAALIFCFSMTVFASSGVNTALKSFMDILFTVTKIVGVGLTLWGVIQLVMALIGHDPNQRLNALFFLGGGVIVFFAKEIIELMGIKMPV